MHTCQSRHSYLTIQTFIPDNPSRVHDRKHNDMSDPDPNPNPTRRHRKTSFVGTDIRSTRTRRHRKTSFDGIR